MQTATRQFILAAQEFRLLEGLRLNPRKSFVGRVRGERITKRKGISIEFADYRDYTDGDDLRHLDWNVLARLESAVIKTYQDEEDLAVHILLDCSVSMEFGDPSKFELGRKLAAAFGYLALCGQDAAYARAIGRREKPMPALRGRSSYPRFANWALALEPGTTAGLAKSLREFAGSSARPGMVILISDGLDPEILPALRIIAGRGHEIDLIQVLSPEEVDPDLEGDLRLLDSESDTQVEITANSLALKTYKENLKAHNDALDAECRRLGGRSIRILSNQVLDVALLQLIKRDGWVIS